MIVNGILTALGAMLILVGLWLAWPPLALIAAGVVAAGIGLMREDGADGATGRPADQA